jgi:hypothetical protein
MEAKGIFVLTLPFGVGFDPVFSSGLGDVALE